MPNTTHLNLKQLNIPVACHQQLNIKQLNISTFNMYQNGK